MIKNLKFSLFSLFFATVLLLGSCVEENEPAASAIVGTWNYDSYQLDVSVNGQDLITYLVQVMGLTQQEAQFAQSLFTSSLFDESELDGTTFTFNPDGTYSVKNDGVEEDSGTYQVQNNNTALILNSSDGTEEEFVIETLTNSRLIISFEDSFEEDIDEDGTLEDIGLDFELTLVK
jgi:hypothetical protein